MQTHRPHLALVVAALTAAAAAQPGPDAGVAEGNRLLGELIAAQKDMAQMTADYVQERTTKLFKKPLQSKGTLAFRRDPGCVVFRVTSPRASVVRLDGKTYEVWHEDGNRLERYVLPSDDMPRLLFDSLAPTRARLDQGFAVASCVPVAGAPTRRSLTLVPTDARTKRVAAEITLLLDTVGPTLCGFGYQDPRGDDVRVELSNLKLAAKVDEATFALAVPAGAKVTVHQVPEPEPKPKSADPPARKNDAAGERRR